MTMRLTDKNKKPFTYRSTPSGAVLTKGKREIYLLFSSVNQSKKAKKLVADNSFNKIFSKGKKVRLMGPNASYIKIK